MFDAQEFDEDGPPAFNGNSYRQQQHPTQPPAQPAVASAKTSTSTSTSAGEFPLTPPAWRPDEEAPNCNLCSVPFDFLVRRHHCRACGEVFCDTCSDHKAMVPLAWQIREPQRVCVGCFRKLQPLQTQLIEANSNAVRANDHYSEEGAIRYFNRPVNFTLGGEIRKASYTIQNLIAGVEAIIEDNKYKAKLLRDSNALLFITTCKLAFIGGLRFGTGLIVVRLPDTTVGWSAPCAIGTIGLTFGAVVGAEVTDFVVPIKASDALDHFKQRAGHVTFAGEAGFAFGPVGRTATAEAMVGGAGVNSALSISNSKGIYGGVTIDGAHVHVRGDVNRKYYGYEPDVEDLFSGRVPPPTLNGKPLYDKLREYEEVLAALPGDDGLPAAWQTSDGFGHPGSPQNSTTSSQPSSYTSFADQTGREERQPAPPMQDPSEGFLV